MSLEGIPMALAHSLTHSILINLLIEVVLNIFSPNSPTKYCSCPKHFLALFGLFIRVLERGKFLSNKMVELVTEVEGGFLFHVYRDSFVGWKSRICYAEEH